MDGIGFSPWVIVVLGGMIVLGIAIAYGLMRNRGRSAAERAISERGAHSIYEREDRTP